MFEVETDGVVKEYSTEEFLKKFGQEAKKDLFKPPFDKHVLIINGKRIVVTLKES